MPETNKKRKRKSNLEVGKQRLASLNEFCKKAFYSRASQLPRNPLKIPSYMEFEELYWAEYKLRQAKLKKDRKIMKSQGRIQDLAEELEDEQDEDNFAPMGFDDHAEEEDARRVDFQIPVEVDLGPLQAGLIDHQDMPPDYDQEDPPIISSYEELVRHHVEGYLASAQQYAQITELSRRVTEWEDKIIPKLQEEEDHGPFDIHKSGSVVISSLGKDVESHEQPAPDTVMFRKVCKNKPPYEVCRLFLATLQLANNYNIEISSDGTLEQAVDTMSLRLLSTRRHFEELEEYRAPSFE